MITFKYLAVFSIFITIFGCLSVSADYTNTAMNFRTRPDLGGGIKRVIPKGEEVRVLREKDGWVMAEYDGEVGYIYGEGLQETKPPRLEYLGNYFITAYEDNGTNCANGNYPTVGYTVAHNSLPFGTQLYIEGVGYRTVEDRGPLYLGDEWLDIYLGDPNECYIWGEKHLDVYLVEEDEDE